MLTIFKYDIEPQIPEQGLMLYEDAKILKVGIQHGKPRLWALVDTAKSRATLFVRIICTGEEVVKPLDGWDYKGTYQLWGGDIVHHVFLKWLIK